MALLGLLALASVGACQGTPSTEGTSRPAAPTPREATRRGEYLVETSGCHGCHTAARPGPNGPESDRTRMLAGHPAGVGALAPGLVLTSPWVRATTETNTAFAGSWGISYAVNLTPDRESGLGAWDADTFVRTIRSGRHRGDGRPILPPMPWRAYARFSDEDLKAVFAYLRTIPAIPNRVPDFTPAADVR